MVKDALLPLQTAVEIGCVVIERVPAVVIVKFVALVVVPPGVVIKIVPDVAVPTIAEISLAEISIKELAFVPPKVTDVALVRLVPTIFTVVPGGPDAGLNEVIVGAGINEKP